MTLFRGAALTVACWSLIISSGLGCREGEKVTSVEPAAQAPTAKVPAAPGLASGAPSAPALSQEPAPAENIKGVKEAAVDSKTERRGITLEGGRAGSWYPAEPKQVEQSLKGFFKANKQHVLDDAMALIVPHAGWRYSGETAAWAYKAAFRARLDRVILMAPSHQVAMNGRAAVTVAERYHTAIGDVALDSDVARALANDERILLRDGVVEGEHAIEVQMPFLRFALPKVPVVPLVLGSMNVEQARALAEALRPHVSERTLVVVSSDFTHYGPNFGYTPFAADSLEDLPTRIKSLDMGAMAHIERKDLEGFATYLEKTRATICGSGPISVLLALLPSGAQSRLLAYDTSGRMTGDFTNTVSYFAAAFQGSWDPDAQGAAFEMANWPLAHLTRDQKVMLLKLARRTIERYVKDGAKLQPSAEGIAVEADHAFQETAGGFVTLEKRGILRGCIGEIPARRPIWQVVLDHAIDAASNDRRFQPVREEELKEIDIEISILTPTRPARFDEIRIGRDGIVLEKDGHRAVFLPQVAPDQGWTLPTTLSHLARKAGLEPDAWKEGANFEIFEAVVFGEHELGIKPE